MRYIDLKNYFAKHNKYKQFITDCLVHIKDLNRIIETDSDFYILWDTFSFNDDLEFYIELNNFFNEDKPSSYDINEKVIVKTLLSIAACTIPLSRNTTSINNSFFIIYSSTNYEVEYECSRVEENNFIPIITTLFMGVPRNYLPDKVVSYLFYFLTYTVIYAKKYSTDYIIVNDLIYNISKIPNLLMRISVEDNIDFLMHLLDWCYDNKHDDIKIFYNILNHIQKKTQDDIVKQQIELCLFRYRDTFEKDYEYTELVTFYEHNANKISLIDKLRVLTQLFIKVDKDKYLSLFSEEIKKLSNPYLIQLIEDVTPNTFLAYISILAKYRSEDFFNLLQTTYGCSREILEATAFYIHLTDETCILEKMIRTCDPSNSDLHFNMIQYINQIYGLQVTVYGESINQEIPLVDRSHRENLPNDQLVIIEQKLIESIEIYYKVNEIVLNENTKFILSFQQIKLPLQQILLKKYGKLFPIVKIRNKVNIAEKQVENVVHITLSESQTEEQEKEVIEYLKSLTDKINFEYKYIDNIEELLKILKSDIYSVISITSHGEIDIREPLNNKIKIGEKYILASDLEQEAYNIDKKRLLYLNICDSGHFKFKNGFILDSLATCLTNNNQATISNTLPINPFYSSTFLMIFLHHLISVNSFKEAYKLTLSLAIKNEFDLYIDENNLTDLSLFKRFQYGPFNKKSIINWGSLLYQE